MYIRGKSAMSWFEAVFYGILQGLTEFLPISSSGHLALAQELLGSSLDSSQRLGFGTLLHLATLLAVVIVYRADVVSLIKGAFSLIGGTFSGRVFKNRLEFDERLALCTLVSSLALLPAAFLDGILEPISSSIVAVGILLIINSVILWFSDLLGKQSKDLSKMTLKNAFLVGVCQLFALLPGISRSGSTVCGMLTQDFDRVSAVRFSFIMSIPTIIGAFAFEMPKLFESGAFNGELSVYLLGAACAALTAIASIKLLSLISKKFNFRIFSYYCFALGVLAVIISLL